MLVFILDFLQKYSFTSSVYIFVSSSVNTSLLFFSGNISPSGRNKSTCTANVSWSLQGFSLTTCICVVWDHHGPVGGSREQNRTTFRSVALKALFRKSMGNITCDFTSSSNIVYEQDSKLEAHESNHVYFHLYNIFHQKKKEEKKSEHNAQC